MRDTHLFVLNGLSFLLLCATFCHVDARRRNFLENYKRNHPVTNCGINSFKCESGQCINEDALCDGKEDCADGSDETLDCINVEPCASKFLFQCDYGACINKDLACDGKRDCRDDSDESEAACNNGCGRDGFMCTSGQCIEASEICDGFPDCVDKSDETPNLCSDIICPRYSYRCKYGACVHRNARCNQTEECFDGSDESNCNRGSTPKPPHGTYECKSGQIIDQIQMCDGVPDCYDNSDETRSLCLEIHCPRYSYRCRYGACVNGNARCNGVPECYDASDEEQCKHVTVPSATVPEIGSGSTTCKIGQFKCKSGRCIDGDKLCNGEVNCLDNSDETEEICLNSDCPLQTFRCNYGACIKTAQRCDGVVNCFDRSDEENCVKSTTAAVPTVIYQHSKPSYKPSPARKCIFGQFRCTTGECIPEEDVCNGRGDCSDLSDESSSICSTMVCSRYTFRCDYGACINKNGRCDGTTDCLDNSDERGCSSGYTTNAPAQTTTVTPADDSCVMPPHPSNGIHKIGGKDNDKYKSGDLVPSYSVLVTSCDRGYKTSPPQESSPICMNQRWTPSPHYCSRPCPPLAVTSKVDCKHNHKYLDSCDEAVDGTVAIIPCDFPISENPKIVQSLIRVCKNGNWDDSMSQCISNVQSNSNRTVVNIFIFNKDKSN